MERKLNYDDFDQFLKDSADELRMRPSAAVWGAISEELNRKKRRIAGLFVLALMLISGGIFTWYTINLSSETTDTQANNTTTNKQAVSKNIAPTGLQKNNNTRSSFIQEEGIIVVKRPADFQISSNSITAKRQQAFINNDIATTSPAPNEENDLSTEPKRRASEQLAFTQATKNNHLNGLQGNGLQVNELQQPAQTTQAEEPAEPNIGNAAVARKNRRLNWTVFITPTVSYRKLSDNKSFERPFLTPGTAPTVSALYNINNAVVHKPDLGLEFGTMLRYSVGRNFKLRTGLQFNISRYDIKAFSYVPEVATIALGNRFGVDSVRTLSNYRNFDGGRSNWLQNFYFQASLPVGLEYELAGNKNISWNVASSIQPTYVIGNRAYLITADYKNYARVPWLIRRWNMNTSLETFVTIKGSKSEWHVGPQVRYQALSSFVKKYPVKENLFDFGMKVGVTIR